MANGIKKVFITALTDVKTVDKEGVGTLRFEGARVYKWVQFSGTTAVAAGSVVCYVPTSGLNLNETSVDGANSNLGAGVSQAAVAAGTVQYGWIQIEGVATVTFTTGGTPAFGAGLTANGATAGGLTVATAVAQSIVGFMVDSANKVICCDFPY
jgi:hypothetical protein